MELAQKNKIIKRFLLENSTQPSQTVLAEDILEEYAELGKLLDYIETNNQNLINFDALEHQERQWKRLHNVLRSICKLNPGNPPHVEVVHDRVEPTLHYFRDLKAIKRLPKDDYFSRVVKPLSQEDDELLELIHASQKILYRLSQDFPHAKAFDPTSSLQIINQINEVQKQLKKYQEDHPHNKMLQSQLTILTDLQKINSLQALVIPQDRGQPLIYCTLPDAAGGVTEKVSLIPMSKAKQQLTNLTQDPSLSLEAYTAHRQHFKLATEAILKLPKHGEITEVQREAMALNISRLLRTNNSTAQSTTVSFNNHPALFIPFADIRLLSDFTLGTTFPAGLGITGQTYTHYSTIKAVGEGIQGDHFVDDFGDALGLLYLSSDTDAIGGYCQNKALTNNRHLFIFDQVIMATDKFLLDARLSLQPDQLIVKHTRHGQGRNRTVIEDSSMLTKFDSIMQLKTMNNKILLYLNHVYWVHHERVVKLKTLLQQQPLDKEQKKQVELEIKDLEILAKDASIIKTAVSKRIMEIDKILPKLASELQSHDVCQAMILAKLLQPPRIFTADGRPYKYPWTDRPALQVAVMKEQEGIIYLRFSEKIPESHLQAICHAGNFKVKLKSDTELLIKKSDLAKINETMLYPECNLQFLPNHDYLTAIDFPLLADAYDKAKKGEIYQCIRQYQEVMHQKDLPVTEKIACITDTELLLNKHIAHSKDKGYGKHILKKFYFDTQQKLQAMIHPQDYPSNIVSAFESALKLDRLSIFNQVVAEAISQDKLHDSNFLAFLNHCQQHAVAAIDHPHAERESNALMDEAQHVLQHLKTVQHNHGIHVLLSSDADGALTHHGTSVDPVVDLEEDLQEEGELLTHLNTLNLETPTTLTTRLRDNEDDNLNNKLN